MKNILFGLLLFASAAAAQSPFYNDVVRSNTLSPARVSNALDAAKAYSSSGTDTYTFTGFSSYTAYHTGDILTFTFVNANTSTTCTANVNSIGALALKDDAGNDLAVGALKAGGTYKFIYNGTNLRMVGGSGGGSGATIYNSDGTITSHRIVDADDKKLSIINVDTLTITSNKDVYFTAHASGTQQTINMQDDGIFIEGTKVDISVADGLVINGDAGTEGDVLTSHGAGNTPTWDPPTGGGGGATAAGATGNVQYKSNGGGLQAESAFSYDSATNLLTVPALTAGSSTALTDAGTVTITGAKHTLTSDEATITWTLSQTSDFQTTDIILNATTTDWTFPANTLIVSEGTATGSNVVTLAGSSGDHYIMSIYKDGSNYRIAIKNFGQ